MLQEIPSDLKQFIEDNDSALMHGDDDLDTLPDGWTTKVVDSYGGEDQGSDFYSVHRFEHEKTGDFVLVKFQGWYQSYEGAELQDWFIVSPQEKTITVYEKI